MKNEVKVFSGLPKDAKEIREKVFIQEQGFQKEYDEIDEVATHLVLYRDGEHMGTCRIFPGEDSGVYNFGRLAVKKEYRGQGLGSELLAVAERLAEEQGGECLMLHAQLHAKEFYEKAGYVVCGELEYEEGCPHLPMKKNFR